MKIGRWGLTTQILVALVLGFIVGVLLKMVPESAEPLVKTYLTDGFFQVGGQIFLSALKLLVVPVVFFSLSTGVASLTDIRQMGRIGGKTLLFYLCSTAIAVTLALIVARFVGPGRGFNLVAKGGSEFDAEAPSLVQTLIGFVPENPLAALVEANMIQIIVLSLLLGIAMVLAGDPGKRIYQVFSDMNEVVLKLVEMVMIIAPIGVFCLIAKVFAEQGFEAIAPLSKYFFTVFFVLILHLVVTYTGLLVFIARLNPVTFFKKFREIMVFAFSTSSSSATLPVTIEVAEKKMGVRNSIASFTLPLGATINMDGTAIMQGVATVFISQAYNLGIGFQGYVMVIVTATLASVGTAGVPGVGLITLAMVLNQVNLPVEGIALIIGIDRLLDMTRTVVNVAGDTAVTCAVAKSEGALDLDIYNKMDFSDS